MSCGKAKIYGCPGDEGGHGPAATPITLERLASATGEPIERLAEWRSMGLIGRDGELRAEDAARARLIHDLVHHGLTPEEIGKAIEREGTLGRFLKELGESLVHGGYSPVEAAEAAGLEIDMARRLMDAAGIHDEHELLDEDDVRFFKACRIALEAGYPEEALLQVLHAYSDAMTRAAHVGAQTSHFYLHQPMHADGLPTEEMIRRLNDTFGRVEPLVEPALMYFFRKGSQQAAWEDMLMHLEERLGLVERPEAPGQIRQAVMFVDLASFTPLAEAMGDLKAAEVLQRFGGMVRKAVRRCHGRIVKQIGDAFMIVFPECFSAVSCALELEERSREEPRFPAVRSGLHWGPVLYREGDYLGSNVNIASRLAVEAERHQILITEEVWRRAKGLEGAEFVRRGKRRLKGLTAEVEVFEVRASEPLKVKARIDPVCGMEMRPGEEAATLMGGPQEHAFCSQACLKKFVSAPDKYS